MHGVPPRRRLIFLLLILADLLAKAFLEAVIVIWKTLRHFFLWKEDMKIRQSAMHIHTTWFKEGRPRKMDRFQLRKTIKSTWFDQVYLGPYVSNCKGWFIKQTSNHLAGEILQPLVLISQKQRDWAEIRLCIKSELGILISNQCITSDVISPFW